MSRDLSGTNLAAIDKPGLQEVLLVKLEYDTPVYCHSGIGTITFDGNDYLGVGDFGGITNAEESESLAPAPLVLQLSGIDANLIVEALDAGTYGDVVTIYDGYRLDDGTLIDDPWVFWKGKLENPSILQGEDNKIALTVQHDLAELAEKDGSRFTDEDQQARFTGDRGLRYVTETAGLKLLWGGTPVPTSVGGSNRQGDGFYLR